MGVAPDEVLAGVGSDEVIALLLTALRPRSGQAAAVVTTTPTFVMYRQSARVRGMNVMEVPLDASWDLAEASLLRALEVTPPNLVFIANLRNEIDDQKGRVSVCLTIFGRPTRVDLEYWQVEKL